MKQKAFNFLTWAVVGVAVLSSIWLAWHAPLSDLRAATNLEDERGPERLPATTAAVGLRAAAASSVTRQQ